MVFERIDFKKDVSTVLSRFDRQVETWCEWETRPLSFDTYEKVMKALGFGKKATKTIEEKVTDEVEGFLTEGYPQPTIWAFYNVITWHITHRTVSLNHRVELENRLRRAVVHLGN